MSRAIQLAIAFISVMLLSDAPPLQAALDAAQKQTLATADKGLTQVEANLKLAQDAAGAGTAAIAGAKARLVQTRLAMAKTPLEQVTGLLKSLPADDAQVAALQKRADAASTAVATIEARLADKPATTPAPTEGKPTAPVEKASTAATSGEVKLDYKQEQLAKDARSYLDEIEGLAGGAADVVKKIQPVKDPLTIDYQLVESASNAIAKARQRAGLVKGRLDQLPEKGAGVAVLVVRFKELNGSLDASDKIIAPLQKKLSGLVDPASYPNLEADIKRVQGLAGMYQNTDLLTSNCERAAALVSRAPAAEAEAERFAKAYAPLVQQKTPQGERVEKMRQYFQQSYSAFNAAAAARKKALPADIEADLAKAGQMAQTAVAEQKPAFFNGGIPQVVGFAEDKLILLTALDPSGAAAVKAKVAKTKEQLKASEVSLKELIISTNDLPPDRYAGKDKANLKEIAIAAWKKSESKAEILAVRFPSEQWDRDVSLRYENRAWHPIDRSKLQAQLLVKQDGKLVVIRPINLWTDHLNNDKVTASPMDDAKNALPPQRYLLIEKIK